MCCYSCCKKPGMREAPGSACFGLNRLPLLSVPRDDEKMRLPRLRVCFCLIQSSGRIQYTIVPNAVCRLPHILQVTCVTSHHERVWRVCNYACRNVGDL